MKTTKKKTATVTFVKGAAPKSNTGQKAYLRFAKGTTMGIPTTGPKKTKGSKYV